MVVCVHLLCVGDGAKHIHRALNTHIYTVSMHARTHTHKCILTVNFANTMSNL